MSRENSSTLVALYRIQLQILCKTRALQQYNTPYVDLVPDYLGSSVPLGLPTLDLGYQLLSE